MNINAMSQAIQEKEMINLITDLMKYRQHHGKEQFKKVIAQMTALLEINEGLNDTQEIPHIQ